MLTNVFILSLVSVLVVSAANVDPRCSRYSLGMQAQVLSYQQDCRKFVICDMGGNGQVLSCPPGLYFNDAAHACSFDMASCTHGELDGPTDALPSVPSLPEQSKPKPSLPIQPLPVPNPKPHVPVLPQPIPLPELPQIPQISQVPPVVKVPVVTDPKPSIPNWLPIITAPPTTVAPVEEHSAVEQLPPQSVCWDKAVGKIYPIAHDCGLYVVCMGDNNAVVQRCPKGLLYDHKHQRCEFADSSFCATPRVDEQLVLDMHGVDMSLLEEERLNELLEEERLNELLEEERLNELLEEERLSELAEESIAVPVVLVKEDASALVPEMVQHVHQPILTVPEPEKQPEPVVEYNFRMIDNHPRCLARNNIHLTVELPHDTDCSKYLVCVGRVAIEKKCPTGQHWNVKHNWCDYASVTGCTL